MKGWRKAVWVIVLVMAITTAMGLIAEGLRILLIELGMS